MKNGSYRIYQNIFNDGKPEQVLVGRFMVNKGVFNVLEDHDKLLEHVLPEGPVTDAHEKFFSVMDQSPYYKLVPEQQINRGLHEDLIEDADLGNIEPEARYILVGDGEPKRLESYGDTILADGQKLSDEELDQMMKEVREGKLKLMPV